MLRNARNFSLFLSLTFATGFSTALNARLPELSSIEPLEFDENSQRLVARGDAQLDLENTRIRADRITYYKNFALADALGNVAITREGKRLIADRLSFDANENIFSVDVLRTGQWPYYVSGASGGGTNEDSSIYGATVYYGNPGPYGLSVSSNEVRYLKEPRGEYVSMDGATFRIGSLPIFYLPAYRHYVSDAPYYTDVDVGSGGDLGVYLQTTTLFPVASWLLAGANLDYYEKRGLLAGPTAQYTYNSQTQQIVGAVSAGYIDDKGGDKERGLDIFNHPIDTERVFAEWRHKHHIGDHFTATAVASYWSDSEVTRDFREDVFNDNRQPDNFVEASYAGNNWIVSAFGRFRPNEFQLVQERLPEIRLDVLPVPAFNTGAYHKAHLSYTQLRENFDDNPAVITTEGESDRFDLTYRIQRPILIRDWLTLMPLAGARLTQYDNQRSDLANIDGSFTREIYEAGFNLEARAHATYPTVNKTWGINGLRHLVRTVLRYRYFSDPDALNEIATIERAVFDLDRPGLDLSDLRHVDDIPETHLVRLGVENLFQTRAKNYGSKTLAALNFYQDILLEKERGLNNEEKDTFNATWLELELNPAPWLKFDFASRFKTESFTLDELRTRTTLRSGEIWELGLSTDLLNQQIDQYRLDFIYRINERYSFLTDARFDADTGDFTKFSIGLRSRIGSTWELLYAITFREGARRESDVAFRIQLRLAGDV